VQDIEEGSGQLVVSCGDGSVDLEVSDHSLDAVAFAIDAPVPANCGFAIGFGWNAGTDAVGLQTRADGITVITLVGEKIGGLLLGKRNHVFERRAIRGFARGEVEAEREPFGITETMNFTGEPAPRPAKSLFASPPFAPAAET